MFGHRLVARPGDLRHAQLAGLAVLAVTLALVLGTGLPGPAPAASGGPSPNGSAIAWTPGPTEGEWARLALAPEQRLADLAPTATVGRLVATSTRFTLAALGAVAAGELAGRIQSDPPLALGVSPGPTPNSVILDPAAPLSDATRYRFRLSAPDGSLAGTWTFRTDAPLHVVGRLPDDRTTAVPTTTGIEVTFDQDSPLGFAEHFSLEPAVAGSFEQHGRTWVFVPRKPLAAATLYTVTVTRGIGVTGSDRILEADSRWQFETATRTSDRPTVTFSRPVVEARPGEEARLLVQMPLDEGQARPTSLPYQLYRVSSLKEAAAAAGRLVARPSWVAGSGGTRVDTSGLTRVAAGNAPVRTVGADWYRIDYVALPVRPDPGWYVVTLPVTGHPAAQALLQVTNVAGYVQTTDTRTVAWVNDLASQAPIAGATLAIPGQPPLGATDAHGVVVVPTPDVLVPRAIEGEWDRPIASVLTITTADGSGLVAPVGMPDELGFAPLAQSYSEAAQASFRWWLVLSTDRTMYRTTDTIHAWGVIRARGDLSVPEGLELRLAADTGTARPPISRVPVTASVRGVFSGDVPVAGLPTGHYVLELWDRADRMSSTSIEIAEIRKPAYQIEVSTDHRAYIAGSPIRVTGRVAFYDGTVAPGISLRSELDGRSATMTAGSDGTFAMTDTVSTGWQSGPEWQTIGVAPTAPEEGQISGSTELMVFPSALWLTGKASLTGSTLTVNGTLSQVDLAKVEKQLANGSGDLDPAGAAVSGHAVSIRVIHEIPVKTQIGTVYDFIAKQLSPVYRYELREETIANRTVQSSASGRVSLSVAVPVASDSYRIELRATDAKGRAAEATDDVGGGPREIQPWSYPYFGADRGACGGWPTTTAVVGQSVDLTVHERDGSVGREGAYLFLTGERGLRDVVQQASPTLHLTFAAADLPSLQARAVRLTSSGYQVLNPARVEVDQASKRLTVRLTLDQRRYAPGDTVNVGVTTLGPDGQPTSADVVVRAVDEKLYTMGGAFDADVLAELMQDQPAGYLQTFASHPLPYVDESGCGGTGGGRADFRDSATFQHVATGANGRATVSFKAPDDLTSWHVSAIAVSRSLDAGSGSVLVPVGLPFFADAIMASTYLVGDRPTILVRAYGDSLTTGSQVRFVVQVPDVGLTRTADASAFTTTAVALSPLPAGDHRVTISATSASGTLSDALVRTVHVIPTRLTQLQYRQDVLSAAFAAQGGSGLTTLVVSDAGRGSLVPVLNALVAGSGARYDQAAAAEMARRLLVGQFGVDPSALPDATFDSSRYIRTESGQIALLPYSSGELELTALAAMTVPDLIGPPADAVTALRGWHDEEDATSERQLIALAGLAALDQDVGSELAAIDPTSLTLRDRAWLGLAFAAAGDETAARGIERAILSASGEQLGGWVRVNAGSTAGREATLDASALTMLLAAEVGDPLAGGLQRYVADQPSTEHVHALETIGYVRAGLDRLPRAEARFAWTIAGVRHEEDLKPGDAFSMALTEAQRATLRLEPLAGNAVVTSTWTGQTAIADLPATTDVTIERSSTPATEVARDGIVGVGLRVTLGQQLPLGTYQVADLLPSGLAPLVADPAWPDDPQAGPGDRSSVPDLTPTAIDGQRVTWLVTLDSSRSSFKLVYRARVVSPGSYVWEPAVVQAVMAPTLGGHTAASTFGVR